MAADLKKGHKVHPNCGAVGTGIEVQGDEATARAAWIDSIRM